MNRRFRLYKMLAKPLVLLLLLYMGAMGTASGQQRLSFNHITEEDGLSSGSVLSIAQDKLGFLWVGTMDGLNRYDGKKVKTYKSFYANNPSGTNIQINKLVADKNQNLWLGTNKGLYRYNLQLDSFQHFSLSPVNANSLSYNNIHALCIDHNGFLWIGASKGLNRMSTKAPYTFEQVSLAGENDNLATSILSVYETSTGTMLIGTNKGLLAFPNSPADNNRPVYKTMLPGVSINALTEDHNKNIWAGSLSMGVFKLSKDLSVLNNYRSESRTATGLINNTIRKITVDSKGRIWIGTLKGLSVLNPQSEHFDNYHNESGDEKALNFNSIYDIFEDRQGNIWVGTYFGGLNVSEAFSTPFEIFKNEDRKNWIKSNVISSMVSGPNGGLWVGTEAEGIYYYDPRNETFRSYKDGINNAPLLSSNLVKALLVDNHQHLWVGLHDGGVNILNKEGRKIGEFRNHSPVNAINSDEVYCLMQDNQLRIWIGHPERGINIYDPKTNSMKTYEQVYPGKKLIANGILSLFQDSKHNIWIGTANGLHEITAAGKFETFKKTTGQLVSDLVNCIAEDRTGMIWLGTHDGLTLYDPKKQTFKTFTSADGLAGDKVMGIVPDSKNDLWISTNNGLSRFTPTTNQFYSFNKYDGLSGSVFNYNSYFKDPYGKLYFGGFNGFTSFMPNDIEINVTAPDVVLTDIIVDGKSISSAGSGKFTNLHLLNEIELEYNQNFLSIEYAVMNFIKPMKNKSAYKLQGYNDNWTYTNNPVATFANLPTGKYTLFIKACNNDGIWNKIPYTFKITILPPPWKTWWAYTLYSLAAALLAFGIISYFSSRIAMRRKLRYQRLLLDKQKELHQMKLDFFTHISHELRTPLTLIMGPVEMLKSLVPAKSTAEKLVATIQNNGERLLKLTNDLLDFRKADEGYTELKIRKDNIVSFARNVYSNFGTAASEKKIAFQFIAEKEHIDCYFDASLMEIVLTNLLSNAMKFTLPGGNISVTIKQPSQDSIEICVTDDGVGIPKAEQDKIFTHFYQAQTGVVKHKGTGIGLAFSKSLVELHGGSLQFQSHTNADTEKNETSFMVILKTGKTHFSDNARIVE